jgi:hypothetical protein
LKFQELSSKGERHGNERVISQQAHDLLYLEGEKKDEFLIAWREGEAIVIQEVTSHKSKSASHFTIPHFSGGSKSFIVSFNVDQESK